MADYQKTNWQNKPSTSTPINQTNLNHMEQGIYNAQHTADQAAAGVAELQGLNFAPIPVSTAAGMTDETKIYVYLGSETGYQANHWYYWNGSAWTEGGVYNSTALVTDPELENAGMAADAKATGDAVSNLKGALSNTEDITYKLNQHITGDVNAPFELGDISIVNSEWSYSADNRMIRVREGYEIELKAGTIISLSSYSDNYFKVGSLLNNVYDMTVWLNSGYTVQTDGKYTIVIRTVPYSNVTDIDAIVSLLNISKQTENIDASISKLSSDMVKTEEHCNLYPDMQLKRDLIVNGLEVGYFNAGTIYPSPPYDQYRCLKVYPNDIIGNKIRLKGIKTGETDRIIYYQSKIDGQWSFITISYLTDNGDGTYTFNFNTFKDEYFNDSWTYFGINFDASADIHAIQYIDNTDTQDFYVGLKNDKYVKGIILSDKNQWAGKKIVWLGTSVGYGAYSDISYPYYASKKLGFELVNTSYPGISINLVNDTTTYCSTLTIEEQSARGNELADSPVYNSIGSCTNNFYMSYENIFSEDNNDADLYVFAVVPNNTNWSSTDWEAFNKNTWAYSDSSAFANHRGTFLGALLFLLDKMYTCNANARCIFLLDSTFVYTEGKNALETIAEYYHIPIVDLWGKINTSPKSILKLYSQNGTNAHPSTFAHTIMGEMLVNELLLLA